VTNQQIENWVCKFIATSEAAPSSSGAGQTLDLLIISTGLNPALSGATTKPNRQFAPPTCLQTGGHYQP